MLEQAIFNEITADTTLAPKLQSGSKYHVYPLFVPEGVLPDRAIAYTEIDQSLTYPILRTSLFQISCFAKTFAESIDLADDIDRIFNDLSEYNLGGVKGVTYVKFQGRSNLYDTDAKLYQCIVELLFKY